MNSIRENINEFILVLGLISKRYDDSNNLSDHLALNIKNDIYRISNEFEKLVNIYDSAAGEISDSDKYITRCLGSHIAEEVKQVLLLFRDTSLEHLKARSYLSDSLIDEDQFSQFLKEANVAISCALEDLKTVIKEHHSHSNNKNVIDKQLYNFSLVESPWKVYLNQYELILDQVRSIEKQRVKFPGYIDSFKVINLKIYDSIAFVQSNLNEVHESLNELLTHFDNEEYSHDQIQVLLNNIKQKTEFTDNLKEILERIDIEIKGITNEQLIIDHDKGKLVTKDFQIGQKISKWVELYVVPPLADLFEKLKILKTNIGVEIQNSLKKLELITPKNQEEFRLDLRSKIDQLIKLQSKEIAEFTKRKNRLEDLLGQEFKASFVYKEKPFLPIGIQSSVNKMVKDQTRFLDVINQRFGKGQKEIASFFNNLQREKLTTAERLAYAIQMRSGSQATESYDQVFESSELFSEFYLIEREAENERASKAIELWKSGYNSSLIITGSPLSGKSTFSNHLLYRHFKRNFLKLKSNDENSIGGRKFNTTTDLNLALEEVSKARIDNPIAILIDDFEIWHDDITSLIQDARSLLSFHSKHADSIFFIIVMNPIALHFLDVYLDFSNKFLSTINLSKCSLSEFKNIIQLRHSATQKTLLKDNGIEYSASELDSQIRNIFNNSGGNIGDGLKKWAAGSKEINAEQLTFSSKDLKLVNIINDQNEIIFEQFFKFKTLSDKELILLFTKEQYEEIRPLMRSMINSKILLRDSKGRISINPIIISDVYRMYCKRVNYKFISRN